MLTDIGGFLKIMTLISWMVAGWYYRRLLHKKLVAMFSDYEKVLCYEGIIQMFKDIMFLLETKKDTDARIDSNTEAIDDLEKQGDQKDQRIKQLEA